MSSEKTEAPVPAAPDLSLQLMTFLEVYKKQILIVIVAGAIVGTASYVIEANHKEKESAAATALAILEMSKMAANPGKPVELTSEELFKVAADYPGTSAAEQANLRGAVALFDAGKFTDAQQKFTEFTATYPESILKSGAELGVAASLEGQKQLDKAAEAYQRVVTSYPTQSAGLQAKLALGNLQELKGQPAQALKLYEEVANAKAAGGAPTAWANEAGSRKSRLLERHPELVPATLPPTVAAPAGAKAAPVVTIPAVKK